ncbi:MAG: prephenate dehydratase [Candidatus Saccharimonadales bacterium]
MRRDTMDEKIKLIRQDIDAVDNSIAGLLVDRAQLVIKMKSTKKGQKIYRPSREAEIIDRVVANNKSAFSDDTIRAIFTEIVSGGRNLEEKLRVAYLGPDGSYSHEASIKLLGSQSEFLPQPQMSDAVKAVERGLADVTVIPIENSTEGSVAETLTLLVNTNLHITGEIILPIAHNLMSHATNLSAIKQVVGHPQALGQCRAWLQANLAGVELIPASSNSAAAKQVTSDKTMAAIAGSLASAIWKLPILVQNIQDSVHNETRFIALSHATTTETGNDKTTLVCTVHDSPGALYKMLGIFEQLEINLLALISHPIENGDYAFYIDFEGHSDNTEVVKALKELIKTIKSCQFIGSYRKG